MKRRRLIAVAMLGSAVLAGCGSSSSTSSGTSSNCPAGGSASSTGSGTVKIGMKGFAEEQLLASMTKQVLEKRGFTVDATFTGFKDIGGNTAEKQIANGECEAGEVFTTDSAIAANNLYVLTDDKKLFPPDNVGLLVKASVQKAHPEIGAIMDPVAKKLT